MLSLKEIEKNLESRYQNISSKYGFYVFITEEEYEFLFNNWKDLSNKSDLPWCQIKLLTEIYLRESSKKDDFKRPLELISKKFNINSSNNILWKNITDNIEKINLDKIILDGKKHYKNIITHAGIPSCYFDNLFEKVKKSYKENRPREDITIDLLLKLDNIFDFPASKFFKEVFENHKEEFFRLLLDIVKIEINIKENNIDITKLNLENKEIPSSFLFYLKNKNFEKFQKIKNRKKNILPKIIFDDGFLKYIVNLPKNIKNETKIKFICNGEIDKTWEKVIIDANKLCLDEIIFKILPKHLGCKLSFSIDNYSENFELPLNLILFDDNFKFISHNEEYYKFKNQLTILSKNQLDNYRKIDDLSDDWYSWNHYELSNVSLIKGTLDKPYENLEIEFNNNIIGEWVIEKDFICKKDSLIVFGGDNPPIFKFYSEENISNYTIRCSFINENNDFYYYFNIIEKIEYNYFCKCNELEFEYLKYDLNIELIDNKLNVIKGFQKCIWYPYLKLVISPQNILLDNEPSNIKLYYKGNLDFIKSIPDMILENKNQNNCISFEIPNKPTYITPDMFFKYNENIININIRLPYLSIWVYSEKLNQRLDFTIEKPFKKEELESIYSKDCDIRIRFYYHGKIESNISIVGIKKGQDKYMELYNFTLSDKEPNYSISYGDLKFYSEILINYSNSNRITLFNSDTHDFWNFESINQKLNENSIYKNIWKYWKK